MECVGSTGAIPAEAPPFYGSWLHVGALYAALCGGLDSLGRTTLGYCLIGPSRGGHLCGCQLAALPVRWKAAQHLLPGTNDSASGDITPRLSWTRRGPPQGCSKLCSSCAVSSGRPTTGTNRDVESAVGESFVVMFEEQFVRCVERTRFHEDPTRPRLQRRFVPRPAGHSHTHCVPRPSSCRR